MKDEIVPSDLQTVFLKIKNSSIFSFVDFTSDPNFIDLLQIKKYISGQFVSQPKNTDHLFVVGSGEVNLIHLNNSNQILGSVVAGRALELKVLLSNQIDWNYKWQAKTDIELLIISKKDLLSYLNKYPLFENYLKLVVHNPELQKFKNDLKLLGFKNDQIFETFRLLTLRQADLELLEMGNQFFGILQSGEISYYHNDNKSTDLESRLILKIVQSDYLQKSDHNKIEIRIEPNTKLWYLESQLWSNSINSELIGTVFRLFDSISEKISDFENTFETQIGPTPVEEEIDDGLTVADFVLTPEQLKKIHRKKPFTIKQQDEMDCGAACLSTISHFHGRKITIPKYRSLVHVTRDGASMLSLKKAAELTGYESIGIMSGIKGLQKLQVPFIALMQYHFVVVYKITDQEVVMSDPARGIVKLSTDQFRLEYSQNALLLKPTKALFDYPETPTTWKKYLLIFEDSYLYLFEILIISIILFIFGLATPLFMQYVFDNVISGGQKSLLSVLAIGMVGVAVVVEFTSWIRGSIMSTISARLDAKFSALFINHVMKLPLNYFAVRRVGDITTRIGELAKIRSFLTENLLGLVINLISILLYGTVVYFYSPKIFLVVFAAVPLLGLYIYKSVPSFTLKMQDSFKAMGKSQSRTFEQLNAFETIKNLSGGVSARWRWEESFEKDLKLKNELKYLGNRLNTTSDVFRSCIKISILLFSVHLYIKNELTLGQVVALASLVESVTGPAISIVSEWTGFNQAAVSLARIDDIFTAAVEPSPHVNKHKNLKIKGQLEFQNVSFQYGSEMSPMVLDNVSLNIKAGETIALIGRSGSGKTTLGYMINLLYRPSKGKIIIDGIDATEIPFSVLRKQVAMIMQDNSLFSGTILENITMGDSFPSFKKAIDAAKAADAHDFISKMPDGYSTYLGENGGGISGGQKQRINIARALYLDPEVLILDEATSALDAMSESIIMNGIKNKKKKCTTIIIAHRLNTIMHADKIIVFDKGRIAELGTHSELMKSRGIYCDLFRKQINV